VTASPTVSPSVAASPSATATLRGTPSPAASATRATGGDAAPAGTPPVQNVIAGFAFQALTVPRGTMVTWVNRDAVDHDVTANDGAFGSPTLHEGGAFAHRFDQPGTFAYHCTIHLFMTGTVVVQ
jgi:plastocyanin